MFANQSKTQIATLFLANLLALATVVCSIGAALVSLRATGDATHLMIVLTFLVLASIVLVPMYRTYRENLRRIKAVGF